MGTKKKVSVTVWPSLEKLPFMFYCAPSSGLSGTAPASSRLNICDGNGRQNGTVVKKKYPGEKFDHVKGGAFERKVGDQGEFDIPASLPLEIKK